MSTEKSWTVVKFDDNSVEAVPTGWLIGNMCYWPPFSQEKIKLAIRKSEMVNTCWPTFKVNFFKSATFDDYMSARLKARKAEETSDLNSGTEVLEPGTLKKMRQRKPKILTSSDSSNDESVLPLPPKIRKESTIKTINVTRASHIPENHTEMESTSTSSRRIEVPMHLQNTWRTDDLFGKCGVSDNQSTTASKSSDKPANDENSFSRTHTGTKSTVGVPKCNNTCPHCCESQLKIDDKSFKQLSSQNHVIRSMVSEVLGEVQQIREVVRTSFTEKDVGDIGKSSIFSKYLPNITFPIKTFEEMEQLEEYMKNEKDFSDAVNEISKYGGANNYNFVKRVLTLLISNALATKYSWIGRKGKKPFNVLAMSRIIIGAADKAGLSTNFKSTETSIQLWLKRSSERLNADQNKRF